MLYDVALVSAIPQHKSVMGIHMSPPSHSLCLSHPSGLLQCPGVSSLSHLSAFVKSVVKKMFFECSLGTRELVNKSHSKYTCIVISL